MLINLLLLIKYCYRRCRRWRTRQSGRQNFRRSRVAIHCAYLNTWRPNMSSRAAGIAQGIQEANECSTKYRACLHSGPVGNTELSSVQSTPMTRSYLGQPDSISPVGDFLSSLSLCTFHMQLSFWNVSKDDLLSRYPLVLLILVRGRQLRLEVCHGVTTNPAVSQYPLEDKFRWAACADDAGYSTERHSKEGCGSIPELCLRVLATVAR